MNDVTALSDADLMAALQQSRASVAPAQAATVPAATVPPAALTAPKAVSDMSDEELLASIDRSRGREAGRQGGYMDAIPVAITTGLLGNLPDYPPAAIEGVKGLFSGEGVGRAFDRSLEEQRGFREGLAEQFPKTTLGGVLGGAVAPGVGLASKVITAPTVAGRVAQSTLFGAGLGGAQGWAGGEGAEGRALEAAKGAGIGAAGGAIGEGVVSAGGKVFGKTLGGATRPAEGVVPAERIAAAEEFKIPLTRGQATGNTAQQAFEEGARNNARGGPAAAAVQGFDKTQAEAIQAARTGIGESLGGTAATADEAGSAVAQALQRKAAGLKAGADEAYASAAAKEASIASEEVANLGRKVAEQLEANGIKLDTYGNYPGAAAAMNLLRRVAGFEGTAAGGEAKVVAQSLEGLEQARKGLLKVKPANGEDARALSYIRRGFDDWISNAMDRKLFSGDPTALDDLLKARSLWSQYKGLSAGKAGDAKPIIAKMVTEERTGAEVANWLLGTVGAGQAGRSARIAAEIKHELGTGAPEWEALRQAAWQKIINPARGEGSQAVSRSIVDFTNGQGAPVARTLFAPEEIGQMQKFATVLRSTVTDPRSTNRGQSGYEIARLAAGHMGLGAAAGGLGAAWYTGDPKYAALAALPLLRSASSLSKGIAATRAEPSAIATGTGNLIRAGDVSLPAALERAQ